MSQAQALELLCTTFAFILGANIGSFLNVVIYRLPLGLSVNKPVRSFCPSCKYQIPFWHNLPIISWLALRGRCASCKGPISPRYLGVELLTGVIFLLIWKWNWVAGTAWSDGTWARAFPLGLLAALLISATFIDFEHYIIPDEITWGGVAAGLACSALVPALHGQTSLVQSVMWSAIGAVAGYGLLWGVVEAGKLAFGKSHVVMEKPTAFSWKRDGQDAEFVVGEDKVQWSDSYFSRESDRLLMSCPRFELNGETWENAKLEFHYDRLRIGDREWKLETLDTFTGEVIEMTIPREAMGFGDVKFLACIGAFLGWKAVLFTLMAASLIGSVIGISQKLYIRFARGKNDAAPIPFGPYLALGAFLWMFYGPQWLAAYWQILDPELPK